eukprot:gene15552-7927_t
MSSCSYITDGWFRESEVMWPGQAMTIKVDEVLFEGKSDFQDVLVFKSETYQEMIVHIPMQSHSNPTSVLIVGGGDGGVLREVCRHKSVTSITMCEIDSMVVDVAKRHLSASTATSFDDPRLTLVHADAAEFVKDKQDEYDVVIVDSSDPVGPAASLFTRAFYRKLKQTMRPGGIMCNQGECVWLHLSLIGECLSHCAEVFPSVDYAFTTVPSYPSGQIGFLVCSLESGKVLRQPPRGLDSELRSQLRYYSEAVHASAFVLPQFAEEVVSKVRRPAISQSLPLSSFHGATPRTPGALKNAALNNNNVLRAAMVC